MPQTILKESIHELINDKAVIPHDFKIKQTSNSELVIMASNASFSFVSSLCKQELIQRGKDNIKARIEIKKACRELIYNLETAINDPDAENTYTEKTIKSFKVTFLNLLSILDKLQLEWQKYDISLNIPK